MRSDHRERVRARVEGTVQGVGFRPHVHRLAGDLGLAGWVLNDSRGVLVEVEGPPEALERFLHRVAADAPPLAVVERVTPELVEATGRAGFTIRASAPGAPEALVAADAATCPDCLAEVLDPADRRHGYPFANCTNCGPRFTIVTAVPYDRPLTTMAAFEMCAACRAEYDDPGDRRFHAQPNACPECGPRLSLPVADVARALDDGLVVALKGLGGYHLACRADHEGATAALRERKHREDKPFALMAADLDAAGELVELTAAERGLLTGRERPILIARRRRDAPVAAAVAPGSPDLGVMMPYTPLHHLLLTAAGGPLVMTSANVSDEPIAYRDGDAAERMTGIADLIVSHDRPIHIRTDDSVVRSTALGPLMVRRARGYVPGSLELPVPAREPITAYGAELKSTVCVAKGTRAWPSHHIGDLENWETLRSLREAVEHFERVFAVEPRVVAHDLHPEYLSTKEAADRDGVRHVAVQHHHAHLAACLAEHGRAGPALGVIYDGTGYGPDETVWGGELLAGGLTGFERAAHLWPVRLPGRERAIREPWRMACAWLTEIEGGEPAPLPGVDPERWSQVASLCLSATAAAPVTTSAGRLCDAVAALCGVRTEVNYEGQAAIELEALATAAVPDRRAPAPARQGDGALDGRELVADVVEGLAAGHDPATVAARFHASFASCTAAAAARAAGERSLETVVLSGGVFQNRLLLEQTAAAVRGHGLEILRPELLPPNDGGIAYGQAAVAANA
ncbi:MAG TPA: carbamoyltransferase HypF [Thermoleophilaceae bacterium]|nr:carbamoyltransferase HypF [Thermoleophilaceae bacterium]